MPSYMFMDMIYFLVVFFLCIHGNIKLGAFIDVLNETVCVGFRIQCESFEKPLIPSSNVEHKELLVHRNY